MTYGDILIDYWESALKRGTPLSKAKIWVRDNLETARDVRSY